MISTKLSEPKARSDVLLAFQADINAAEHSTSIQQRVTHCRVMILFSTALRETANVLITGASVGYR
jgi:hypothetical protein